MIKGEIGELLRNNDNINIETSKGFISLVGGLEHGILSKIEGTKEFLSVGGEWVQV